MADGVEYRVFQAGSAEDIESRLNEAAQAGFRLVQAVQTGEGGIFVVMEGPVSPAATRGESARTAGVTAGAGSITARPADEEEPLDGEDLLFIDPV
jgi:hypothetical protein